MAETTTSLLEIEDISTPAKSGVFFIGINMAKISLLVTSSPIDSQLAYSAYQFASAAIDNNHQINGIFFYQSGVHNANSLQVVLNDEIGLVEKWKQLSQKYKIPLNVCVTAANKRGIISQQDALDEDLIHFNLEFPFQAVGLGELIQLSVNSDRLVQF